jgi:hypothetical protein
MRKSLFTAAAVAPLALMLAAPAHADTTVSSTSSPVSTATVNNGAADNLVVGSGASVTTDGPASVTLNSNNSVTNNGSVTINANSSNNNTSAVLLKGGFTGSFTNSGSISNTDGYTASTNSTNGFADGAFAQGTARYGLRLVGPGGLTGDITLNSGSTITVQGNNSYGVSLEAPLTGDLISAGSISMTGSSSTGLSETGGISGKLRITGAVSVSGGSAGAGQPGATAVNVGGDVGGSLSIYSAIAATGYRSTVRSVDPSVNAELTSDQLQISGPALQVGANVHGGVILGSAPAGTVSSDATTDADHDGVVDSAETPGSLTVYGTAPALLVGANGKTITLGQLAAQNPYGLILEGNVAGNGVFDTFSANAIQIGGVSGSLVTSGAVNIQGGISITDTSVITAQAYQANATTIHIGSGVTTPLLQNAGTITALSTESNANTAFSTTALQIEQGASLSQLVNTGIINSTLTGDLGSAYAVVDKSGTLTSVTNMGTINAKLTPQVSTGQTQGSAIALDLSKSTGAVTLIQEANPNPVSNPATTNSAGAAITQATTVSPTNPSITGDILLGSGAANVQFLAGTVNGALAYGAGGGSLLIDKGATYTGALTAGGNVAINVNNGALTDTSPTLIHAGSLHVGSSGVLNFAVDPVHNTATIFNVSGAATLDTGSQLGVNVTSLLSTPGQFTVIKAGSLSVGTTGVSVAQTPYLFIANFTSDPAAGTVTLDVRRRTAAEAQLNRAEAAAWDPVYNSLGLDPQIQQAFLAQTNNAGIRSMLDQVLPDYAGGVFRALTWASEQQGVATAEPPLGQDQAGPTRAWTQEIVLDETKRSTADSAGYSLMGVGAVAGLESVSPKGTALGARISFATVNVRNPELAGDNLLGVSEIGGGIYWRGAVGALKADAQLGAGFIWANDRREFLSSDTSGVTHRTARGDWNGYTMSGRVGVRYTAELGPVTLEPRFHADYFRLHENGYAEAGGGQGFDLAVDPRTGDMMSVTGSILAGMTFGTTGFRWRPQIEIGYRDVILGQAGTTTATFIGGSDPFSLLAEPIKGGAAVGRVGVRLYSDYVDVLLDAGGQFASDYTDLDVHLTARTVF